MSMDKYKYVFNQGKTTVDKDKCKYLSVNQETQPKVSMDKYKYVFNQGKTTVDKDKCKYLSVNQCSSKK